MPETRTPPSIAKLLFALVGLVATLRHEANAVIYEVAPNSAGSMTLGEAMKVAKAGDTIELASGTYDSAIVSERDGAKGNPITIVGSPSAIIKGDYSSRSVLVRHSYISLVGFTVEGKVGSSNKAESFVNKCVYVEGQGSEPGSPLDGFVMEGLTIQNCGGECVRLKNFVTNAEIIGNTITDCGIHDYVFNWGSKNGEGIYVGTSSSQWTYGADETNDNVISRNKIITNANECVDIKEGSTGNIVEENSCSNQLDENSGCYDARGDANTFRFNVGSNCKGAGVRLGGWEIKGHKYGGANHVYGNDFTNVGHGAIKALTQGQGDVCGNTCEDGECGITGGAAFEEIRSTWNQACGGLTSDFTPPVTTTTTTSTAPATTTSSSGSSSATMPDEDGSATVSSTSETTGEVPENSSSSSSSPSDKTSSSTSSSEEDKPPPSSSEDKPSSSSSSSEEDKPPASSSEDKPSSSTSTGTGGKATPFSSSSSPEKRGDEESSFTETPEEGEDESSDKGDEEGSDTTLMEEDDDKNEDKEEEGSSSVETGNEDSEKDEEDTEGSWDTGEDVSEDGTEEPISSFTGEATDEDDYGNDNGDDFDADDGGRYGNDHGDDFDEDDDSNDSRRNLRGVGGKRGRFLRAGRVY